MQVADGSASISDYTALQDLKRLCVSLGWAGGVSTKGFKISGTSDSFRAGLTVQEVSDKGRWTEEQSANQYRTNHMPYKVKIAGSNSINNLGRTTPEGVHQDRDRSPEGQVQQPTAQVQLPPDTRSLHNHHISTSTVHDPRGHHVAVRSDLFSDHQQSRLAREQQARGQQTHVWNQPPPAIDPEVVILPGRTSIESRQDHHYQPEVLDIQVQPNLLLDLGTVTWPRTRAMDPVVQFAHQQLQIHPDDIQVLNPEQQAEYNRTMQQQEVRQQLPIRDPVRPRNMREYQLGLPIWQTDPTVQLVEVIHTVINVD